MAKVSSIFSWIGGVAQISSAWWICLYYYIGAKQSYQHLNLWWLILIAVAYTIIGIIVLICRDIAVANGEHVIAWAVITLLFISLLGGIFTFGVESSSSGYRPRKYYYPKKTKEMEESTPIEEPEFVFVNPSSDNPIKVGNKAKVKEGFYISSIGQRVNAEEMCEIVDLSDSNVTISINRSNSVFNATTQIGNIMIEVKNPKFVQKQENVSSTDNDGPNEKSDKFEEIKRYKELLDLNIITQEEFDAKKKELL